MSGHVVVVRTRGGEQHGLRHTRPAAGWQASGDQPGAPVHLIEPASAGREDLHLMISALGLAAQRECRGGGSLALEPHPLRHRSKPRYLTFPPLWYLRCLGRPSKLVVCEGMRGASIRGHLSKNSRLDRSPIQGRQGPRGGGQVTAVATILAPPPYFGSTMRIIAGRWQTSPTRWIRSLLVSPKQGTRRTPGAMR